VITGINSQLWGVVKKVGEQHWLQEIMFYDMEKIPKVLANARDSSGFGRLPFPTFRMFQDIEKLDEVNNRLKTKAPQVRNNTQCFPGF